MNPPKMFLGTRKIYLMNNNQLTSLIKKFILSFVIKNCCIFTIQHEDFFLVPSPKHIQKNLTYEYSFI